LVGLAVLNRDFPSVVHLADESDTSARQDVSETIRRVTLAQSLRERVFGHLCIPTERPSIHLAHHSFITITDG
jgi:hypothetical protein